MPELTIHVPSYIGPSYMDWDEFEWVQGITWQDIEMQMAYAEMMGEPADSLLLSIGACDGGSTLEGFNIYNKLRALGLPIRTHVTGYAASMAVPLALAGDELPEMDYLAQLMLHAASFGNGVSAETSVALRAQADRLDNTNQLLFDLLTARTGQPADVVNGWLTPGKDTWLTATQAKAVGLCGKLNPLPAATTATEADSLVTARRTRSTAAVARADKRAALTASVKTAAPAVPFIMPDVKKPTGQAAKPTPRAAAKPAATPTAKTAQPQARKTLFQQLKELFDGASEAEVAEAETEPASDVQSTALTGGASVYHDGAIVVGTTAIFNDEALTEPTADGDYDTADSQVLTVADGICTALGPDADASTTTDSTAVAALRREFEQLKGKLATAEAEVAQLKKLKPALPQARAARPNAETPDPKAKAKPTAADPGAGVL